MYLLDTDTLSFWMKPAPPPALEARMRARAASELSISSITVGEIYYGAYRMPRPEKFLRPFEDALRRLSVFGFGIPEARFYGELKATLRRQGRTLDDPDLRIAAIALAHGLTLVTGNARHFSRVKGLRLENWLS